MIDLHCHLDLYPRPHEIVAQCRDRGVFVLSVTTTPAAFEGTSALVRDGDPIETALGLHPQLAGERHHEVALFDRLLPRAEWVGEIGLDGTPEHKASWPTQVRVFEHILRSCEAAGGRRMSIHSRAAASPVIDTLKRFPAAGAPVLHWFSGTHRELDAAIAIGCWFSVGPPMVLSKKGRSLVASMPRDRILTETDGPFVETQGRAARPWDVGLVEAGIAELLSTSVSDVQRLLCDNLARMKQ